MSRPHDKSGKKKVDVVPSSAPLQSNPFAVLAEIDSLKSLVLPEPAAPKGHPKPENKRELEPTRLAKPTQSMPFRGRLVLRREKKDRGGKTVVVISGFKDLPTFTTVMIADLTRDVKNKLGCGGSFDRQEIVLQGDNCGAVAQVLEGMGFRVDGVKKDGPP